MNLYVNGAESAVCMLFLSLRKMSTSEFVISLSRKVSHSLKQIMRMDQFIGHRKHLVECLIAWRVREKSSMENLCSCVSSWSVMRKEMQVVVSMSCDHRFVVISVWILVILRKDVWVCNLCIKISELSQIFF